MFDLTGRTAIVTGAGQGVGAGIAEALASQGAAVAVNDLYEERAAHTVEAIESAGGQASAAAFDVCDYASVKEGFARIEANLGPVDILINNAGVPPGMGVKPFRETSPDEWRPYIDLNIYGVMNCCHVAIDGMSERGRGRVVTISSGAGTVGIALGIAPYGAGKGGGIAFMRHFAMEVAKNGITANTVAIGLIDNHADPSVTEHMAKTVPVGVLGQPDDIAAVVIYLASDEAAWMTGQTIQLNGGNVTT
ncbi:MAG: SDR family NAD(P)-dependent oxidoreductase [Myxococcota bacterium]|nr:SDR family NAD(P)-dependent oxidoreductase [Myxococcota bacterium]